jgi:hypothetical protein
VAARNSPRDTVIVSFRTPKLIDLDDAVPAYGGRFGCELRGVGSEESELVAS